jgi:SAM-dependent methyltransferase
MRPEAYQTMRMLQTRHWWWRGLHHFYRRTLREFTPQKPQRVLDVGCGFGVNLPLLEQEAARGGLLVGMDISREALESIPRRSRLALVQARADALPFRRESFDTLALLAVLEHVECDAHALRESYRVARHGALQLILTSAFMLLWSPHDVANGHHRRYRASQLEPLQLQAGWRALRTTYVNAVLFPLAVMVRFVQRRLPLSEGARYDMGPDIPWLSGILEGMMWLESLPFVRSPFGVNLFSVTVKHDS